MADPICHICNKPISGSIHNIYIDKPDGETGVICDSCNTPDNIYNISKCYECHDLYLTSSDYIRSYFMHGREYFICQTCIDDNYTECECCNEMDYNDNIVEAEGCYYCESCAETRVGKCECCDESFLIENSSIPTICQSCFDANYTYCISCEEPCLTEESRWSNFHDGYICENCGNRRNRTNTKITRVHNITPQYIRFPYSYPIGLEVECLLDKERYDELRDDDQPWKIVSDGSIQPDSDCQYGIEFCSPPLHKSRDTVHILRHLHKLNDEYEFDLNSTCGVHVHVGLLSPDNGLALPKSGMQDSRVNIANQKTWIHAKRVLMLWQQIEPLIFAICGADRIINQFCMPANKYFSIKDIHNTSTASEFYHRVIGNYYKRSAEKYGEDHPILTLNPRYMAINLISLAFRGSIEFRTLQATLDTSEILDWTYFCAALVSTAEKISYKQIRRMHLYNPIRIMRKLKLPKSMIQRILDRIVTNAKTTYKSRQPYLRRFWNAHETKYPNSQLAYIVAHILHIQQEITATKIGSRHQFFQAGYESIFRSLLTNKTQYNSPVSDKDLRRRKARAFSLLKHIFEDDTARPIVLSILRDSYKNRDISTPSKLCQSDPLKAIEWLKSSHFGQLAIRNFTTLSKQTQK